MPFADYGFSGSSTSSVNQASILTSIQSVLQNFPQHATPIYQQNTAYRLRQRIRIEYLELNAIVTGGQATSILPADLYNTVRMVIYISGQAFQEASQTYLSSVINHPNTLDIDTVLHDHTYCLPSQAFDSTGGYNVPQVLHKFSHIPVNRVFPFYSSTTTGTGAWDTEKFDLILEHVSDSSATPHPDVTYQVRIFFSFV